MIKHKFIFVILVLNKKDKNNDCCSVEQNPSLAHHRRDESVFLQLVPDGKLKSLERSYLRVSGNKNLFDFITVIF